MLDSDIKGFMEIEFVCERYEQVAPIEIYIICVLEKNGLETE